MKGKREERSIDRFYYVRMLQSNMQETDQAAKNGNESYICFSRYC